MHHEARRFVVVLALLAGCGDDLDPDSRDPETGAVSVDVAPDVDAGAPEPDTIEHVFLIVMENKDWSAIAGNPAAPYINDTLLSIAAHAESYYGVPGLHPSEPNYIWLESGADLGLTTDGDPSPTNSSGSTDHLVTQLEEAGVSWKSYQESMPVGVCPIDSTGFYAAKHDPFVFFRDVTDSPERCIAHIRPMTELGPDLDAGDVASYVFLTPNLCNDMHGASGCPSGDPIALGDAWLAQTVPAIMASSVYQEGHSAILITWDESGGGETPIGMIVVSPHATAGHASTETYSHSSTLRTLQEVFGVGPPLGDAVDAVPIDDLLHR